jgi:hypothetical protein
MCHNAEKNAPVSLGGGKSLPRTRYGDEGEASSGMLKE